MPTNDEDRKKSDFGPGGAEKRHQGGKTKYDVPSTPDEDTATDERRSKPIRGSEPHEKD